MANKSFLANDDLEHLSDLELIIVLHNEFLLNRAKALFFLGKRCAINPKLINLVQNEILAKKNINRKVIGTVSISFFGIAGLIESNHPQTRSVVNIFLETTKEYPYIKDDLCYFLKGFDYKI